MAPLTYSLAFSRLAPVQCLTWGHPVTSGIDTIDYFISAFAMEPPGSESQYTERLVRLDSPAVYYFKPALPAQPKTRGDFELPEDATLYGCLQMMWKIHPEFDAILAEILRRDPRGLVLLLEGTSPFWTNKLLARLKRTMPDVVDRIRIIRSQKYEDFLTLTSLCDVMLDPIHFGGGNTSYEAFAFGVPIITWPSQMLRGRIAYALYDLMGIDDCTAASHEHFVDLAVDIGADPKRRREVSEKILAAHPKLFENPAGVRALEKFLKSAVAGRARS
jgi:predicted O-linked N-acetylglucosamine transferase (SPINDLY family)